MNRVFKVKHGARWDSRDLTLVKYIIKTVLCDGKEKVNTATWRHHPGWEPLTITVEGHWSISHSLHSTTSSNCLAASLLSGCSVLLGIALPYILFICLCICEELHYSLLVFVLLGEMVQQMVKKRNRPVVSETNKSLRGESTLHLLAYSVFVMPSSSLRGPFEGQKRILRELSQGFLVVVNNDL